MNDAPPVSATGFWSIERFVAFVLGPIATAGSGWLSTFVAKKWGIHLGGSEIVGVFGIGGLAAAGLAYKWLHGRQIETQVNALYGQLPSFAKGFIHTTLSDLEGLAQHAATEAIGKAAATPAAPVPAADGAAVTE